jgi:hypothetical protein
MAQDQMVPPERPKTEVVMAQDKVASGRCAPARPKDALRIGFGVIWLIDAVLKWLPGFKDSYMSTIMGIKAGQPGWLQPWFQFWINLQHPAATFFWPWWPCTPAR